jgi:hypothetical protein
MAKRMASSDLISLAQTGSSPCLDGEPKEYQSRTVSM